MAKCTPEKFLETARPTFKKAMDNALEDGKQWTPLSAATGIVKDLLKPIENNQGDLVKEYTQANAFLQFLRESEDYSYVVDEIKTVIKGEPSSIIKDLDEVPVLNELIDGDDVNPFIEAQILLEGRETDEGESSDSRSPEGRVFDAGFDFSNSVFLKGIGRMGKKDVLDISLKAQKMTFDEFTDYVETNLDPSYMDTPKKIKGLKNWYVSNLPVNRKYLSDKDHFYLSDIYYKTVDGKKVPYKKKDQFHWVKKSFETDESGRKTFINPLNNNKEPITGIKAFYETINVPYGGGLTLADATMKISLADGFLSGRINKDGEVWYKPANAIITPEFLEWFDKTSIETFNLTFMGISTGSNSSNIILGRILNEHYNALFPKELIDANLEQLQSGLSEKGVELLTKNNYDLLKTLEDFAKDDNITVKEQTFLQNGRDILAGKGFISYFENEYSLKNITKEQLNDYKNYVASPLVRKIPKYADFASQIARYRWYQTLMDSSFMKMGNALDIFNRLRLMFSPGTQVVGVGKRKGVLIDPKKTLWEVDGEVIDHRPFIASLSENKYLGDGALFTASSYFDLMQENWGIAEQLFSLKSVQMHKSDKGFGLDKDQRFVSIPNLVIKNNDKKSQDFGKVVLQTYLRDNKVYIEGPGRKNIDEFLTPDERKLSTGIYSEFNKILTYEENSERVLYLDKPKHDASYPFQQIELLTDLRPEYQAVREILEEHIFNVAEGWSNLILNMAKSNNALKEGARRILEYHGKDLKTEIQKHYEYSDKALNHPTLQSGLLPMITNMFIRDGMYKVRTTGRAYIGSTKLKLKPAFGKNYTPSYSGVIVGGNNRKMFELVKNRMFRDSEKAKNLWNIAETKDDKIDLLNSYLRNVDTRVLVSRIPVDSITAVALKRVEKFTHSWDSDAAYFHPEFLFGPFRADSDGDTGQLEILPSRISKKLINKIGDKVIFVDLPVELNDFKDSIDIKSISNMKSFFVASAELGKTAGTQGMAYNARSIRANLAFKQFKLLFDTAEIEIIQPNDTVQMHYAPLKDHVTEEKYKDIPNAKIIKRNDGERILQTSSDHEMSILANAATDNAKKLKLYSFGYRGKSSKDAKPQDWFITKIFKIREHGVNTPYKVVYRKSTKVREVTDKPQDKSDIVPAYTDHKNKQIMIDKKALRKKFEEKAWTIPKVPGVTPLDENQFSTYEEFEHFVIMHEIGHTLYPARPGERKGESHYHTYEDRMNQFALDNMNNKWIDQSSKPTGVWRRLDINEYNDLDYIQILRKVMSYFNTSTKKNTLKQNRKLQSIEDVYQTSREMHQRNQMTSEELIEDLAEEIGLSPKEISLNNNVSPGEKLLATPFRMSEKYLEENNILNHHPFYRDEQFLRTAHQYSIRNLPFPEISSEAKIASEKWIAANAETYFELVGRLKTQKSKSKSNPSIQRIDFDEEIVEWTKKSIKEIALLPEGTDQGITYRFLEGIGNREKMNFFAPIDLLNKDILNSYKDLWDDYYFMDAPIRDKISFKKTDKSYRITTGEKIPEDCIKYRGD